MIRLSCTLLAILLFINIRAQTRYCDTEPRIIQPDSFHTYNSPIDETIIIDVKNNGPDTLQENDNVRFNFTFGSIITNGVFIKVGKHVAPNESFEINHFLNYEFIGNADSIPFCVKVSLYNVTDTLLKESEKDLANNLTCIPSSWREKSGADNTPTREQSSKSVWTYKNPLDNNILVLKNQNTTLTMYEISIFNLTGQLMTSSDCMLQNGEIIIPLNVLPGLYFVNINTADNHRQTLKLLIL
ncbi:MAG: hypothetical protein ACI8ZN_002115 [Bacteroidia bacterium]|jgi:hypothetical protein